MTSHFGQGLRALIVDDDASIRIVLQELLGEVGFELTTADCLAEGLARWSEGEFDLVITDKNLGDGSGLTIVERVIADTTQREQTEVIIMSAFASLESAVEAIRMRVADYLVKPFEDIDAVVDRIRRVVAHQYLKRMNRSLVDELQEKNDKLEDMVVRDGLTGLFNHAYFQERLENELHRSERHKHECGLVFIDIDRFKSINDGLGHQIGDAVLEQIAGLLRGRSRAADDAFRLREHDIAARYGGDEFVLILPETSKIGAATKAERLRQAVEQMKFPGVDVPVTLSVGVAAYPWDGKDRPSLVRAADMALYASKHLGRNRVMSYTPDLNQPNTSKSTRVSVPEDQLLALERSLERGAFEFVYQPIVESSSWRIYGYEALCRPADEVFANVMELISTAERSGKVAALGRAMRASAVEPMDELANGFHLFINIHQHEMYDPSLVDAGSMKRPWAQRTVLELPEPAVLENLERVRRTVDQLKVLGFKIALSDLGASYGTLEALSNLDVDYIKLSRRLLSGAGSDSRSERLLKHILDFANGEGIKTIAEGIETLEQLEQVQELKCPLMQGFLFGKGEPPFAAASIPGSSEPGGEKKSSGSNSA